LVGRVFRKIGNPISDDGCCNFRVAFHKIIGKKRIFSCKKSSKFEKKVKSRKRKIIELKIQIFNLNISELCLIKADKGLFEN